ncbi:hypothetical protein ACQEUX_19975 [Micromonospora sp. CA-259024]|uniref:hypothetical protein n=1 Tax=Micromonospora sp. CA-259024 TaxID=3239965 RepID=UPI003D8F02DD
MAYPRKYSHDFIDATIQQVTALRDSGHRGPITAVARELNLDRRLVQEWISKTRTPSATPPAPPDPPPPQPAEDPAPALLPAELLHCRTCQQPMTNTRDGNRLVYQCPGNCRRHGLDAVVVADTLGRAILRHAPAIVTAPGQPKSTNLAAAQAGRILARVTAGSTATDLRFTWRTVPAPTPGQPGPAFAERLRSARALAGTDPQRARETLREALATADPTTTEPTHADAAHLYAELLTRLGNPAAAIRWAGSARHSRAHLHGPSARSTLAAVHTLATAHRQAGHHQRAYHAYRHLADQLTATAGPDAHPTLVIQATLALVLRDLGHCGAARRLLANTITAHRRTCPHHPATARMLHHLHEMWQHCAQREHDHPDIELGTADEQRQHGQTGAKNVWRSVGHVSGR